MTVGIICLTLLACCACIGGFLAFALIRRAEIQQAGIDRRAMSRAATVPIQEGEWWEKLIAKAIENPEIVKMISPYLPGIMEKLNIKK